MAFDLAALSRALKTHERVVRVLVAGTSGSTPREAGTAMLVWGDGQFGTIAGGALEFQAIKTAREMLPATGIWQRHLSRVPLGPRLGQCCGGAVTLLSEGFSRLECDALTAIYKTATPLTRPVFSGPPATADGAAHIGLNGRKMTELFSPPRPQVWIYGAGHVGRAVVNLLPGLGYDVTWVDTAKARFPAQDLEGVTPLVADNPGDAVRYAPVDACHLVMTYSHALDLDICHRILSHGFGSAGLIGSATKWARFRQRLAKLGHSEQQIQRICCPIGQPELGKSPEAVALGIAADLIRSHGEITLGVGAIG